MFAVPGWSLSSAAPTTQVDKSTEKKKREKKKKGTTGGNSIPISKKREPEKPKPTTTPAAETIVVNNDNVLSLYEKVIEGKDKDAVNKKRKRERERERKKERKSAPADQDGEPPPPLKKKKTLKDKRREKKAIAAGTFVPPPADVAPAAAAAAASPPAMAVSGPMSTTALTPLQLKMRAKLSSARFRHINETLYTTPSSSSFDLFKTQPEMYQEYHTGFRQQVEVWPENPVDIFISQLKSRSAIGFTKGHSKRHLAASTSALPLPRDQDTGVCTVADLGCGDAKIAVTFNHPEKEKKGKKGKKGGKEKGEGKIKVLSYDLQASTPDVTVADIANLPLEAESVDVVIFCLALMGTNFLSFVDEAHRILRWRGELWVAEIKSRFNRPPTPSSSSSSSSTIKVGSTKNKAAEEEDEDVAEELLEADAEKKKSDAVYKNFVDALQKRGFTLRGGVDAGNRMFVRMEFVKMPERERRIQEEEEEEEGEEGERMGGKGKKKGGKGGEKDRMKKKKGLKFITDEELRESDILKPCVYKLR